MTETLPLPSHHAPGAAGDATTSAAPGDAPEQVLSQGELNEWKHE